MPTQVESPQTRRALIQTAAAGAAGLAIGAFARPGAARAFTGTMMFGDSNEAGTTATTLTSASATRTLEVGNYGTGNGLRGLAVGAAAIGVHGGNLAGYGVIGDTGGPVTGIAGVWGRDFGAPVTPAIGTAGTSTQGTGVVGYVHANAVATPPPTYGTRVGVYGYAPAGTGVVARTDTGTALRVVGRASFSRSGRARVPKGKAYVDVDLDSSVALAGSPLCFANVLTRRPGVHVETVRPNYPTAGRLRIYLNKVASASTATTICWVVLG